MTRCFISIVAAFCFTIFPFFGVRGEEPVSMLDLRYTLRWDLKDPARVLQVWDHMHVAATFQGVVNRKAARIYYLYVERDGRCLDRYWLEKFQAPGEWLHDREIATYETLEELIAEYRDEIDGVVLYDPEIASTSNVASAVAGIENLIAVRYDPDPESLCRKLVSGKLGLPVKRRLVREDGSPLFSGTGMIPGTERPSSGSLKCDPYLWFIEHYVKTGKCDTKYAAYYLDQFWRKRPGAASRNHHTLSNHDFFVSRRAFFFDLSPWGDEPATDDPAQRPGTDLETLKEFLLLAYRQNRGEAFCHIGGFPAWAFKYTKRAGGRHGDVPTEWEFSRIISAYDAFKDADAIDFGAMANASFWQHFPLKARYEQKRVSREELAERGYLTEEGKLDLKGREFVLFYVGDYDAASWVYQTAPTIWDNQDRSRIPLMWCISPVLDRRVPMAMHYIRQTASPNDHFAAADNGAGYLMPGMLQEPRGISSLPDGLDAWAKHCKKYYERWDLTITGFIIDGEAPGLNARGLDCYASFSPDGIVPQKVPLTLLHGTMPVLRADWDIVSPDPRQAAATVRDRVKDRPIPFHWFRSILKTPTWHLDIAEELRKTDPRIEFLDAPTFFALYRIFLEENSDAAEGRPRSDRGTE